MLLIIWEFQAYIKYTLIPFNPIHPLPTHLQLFFFFLSITIYSVNINAEDRDHSSQYGQIIRSQIPQKKWPPLQNKKLSPVSVSIVKVAGSRVSLSIYARISTFFAEMSTVIFSCPEDTISLWTFPNSFISYFKIGPDWALEVEVT